MTTKPNLMIADRYELGDLLSTTTLGKLFRAHDFISEAEDEAPRQVLIFAVEPKIFAYPGFSDVITSVMARFAQENAPLNIADAHEYQGVYWIVLDEPCGELLINNINQRHASNSQPSTDTVQPSLINILQAVKDICPKGGFGFIEPGAILCQEDHYKILNAPVVMSLIILFKNNDLIKHELQLNSAYCSPQVSMGNIPTPQDDTFAIACIAYHILYGRPPFTTLSTLEAYHQKKKPSVPANLNSESQISLQRGLSLEWQKRQMSPYELVHAFTSIPTDSQNPITNNDKTTPISFRNIASSLTLLVLLIGIYKFHNQAENSTKTDTTQTHSLEAQNTIKPSVVAPSLNVMQTPPTQSIKKQITAEKSAEEPIRQKINQQISKPTFATQSANLPVAVRSTEENQLVETTSSSYPRNINQRSADLVIQPDTSLNIQKERRHNNKSNNPPQKPTMPIQVISPTIIQPSLRQPAPATVIPLNENTFVVGSAPSQTKSPTKRVIQTQVFPQGENTFIVMPD
ncbi:hypothetical protein RCF98_15615 [Thiothrix lacustris]|uniref:Protein kinase domain-containing protein n=1 Tax=Thiothrix lacustris TaxID=525917 RepID=A0ABY9MNZ0_9GAMM|nr:hypothetical protein [Thiothrix lacustris]WML90385.1 hypothetical protein RCF98_15615 [Thiothrix lacustris]